MWCRSFVCEDVREWFTGESSDPIWHVFDCSVLKPCGGLRCFLRTNLSLRDRGEIQIVRLARCSILAVWLWNVKGVSCKTTNATFTFIACEMTVYGWQLERAIIHSGGICQRSSKQQQRWQYNRIEEGKDGNRGHMYLFKVGLKWKMSF